MDSSTRAEQIQQAETLYEGPSDESIRAGHEVRDVSIRAMLWLAAAVFGVVVVVIAVLLVWMSQLEAFAVRSDPERSPLAEPGPVTAAPRLQATPVRDYLEYRRQQEETLDSYGWVDRENGIVRVPVSRAMELILEQGLPEPSGFTETAEDEP